MDAVGTGAAFAIALGLVRVAEAAIAKIGNGKGKKEAASSRQIVCAFATEHNQALAHLAEIVGKTDEAGLPLIYVPRRMMEQQKEIIDELRAHGRKLERIATHLSVIRNGGTGQGTLS